MKISVGWEATHIKKSNDNMYIVSMLYRRKTTKESGPHSKFKIQIRMTKSGWVKKGKGKGLNTLDYLLSWGKFL